MRSPPALAPADWPITLGSGWCVLDWPYNCISLLPLSFTDCLKQRTAGEKFAADFAAAFAKLMELGVPFKDEGSGTPGQYVAPPGERPKGETVHATH